MPIVGLVGWCDVKAWLCNSEPIFGRSDAEVLHSSADGIFARRFLAICPATLHSPVFALNTTSSVLQQLTKLNNPGSDLGRLYLLGKGA